jgi:acetolactate synthase small subunit
LTDPDPNLLTSAAAYLVQVARTSKGGRYRKSAKIEALRECKEEILEAHRSGISIHRIAQIFRERNVDISTQHNAGDPAVY